MTRALASGGASARSSALPRILALVLALGVGIAPANAQAPGQTTPETRLLVKSDLWLLGGFAAATVALFPFDRQVTARVRAPALLQNRTIEETAKVAGFLGFPGSVIIGSAMYAAGELADEGRLSHLAVHGTASMVVGLSTVFALKLTLGRARPYVTSDTNPRDFAFMRGFRSSDYQSFPSGHTAATFAVAAAVTSEMRRWYPDYNWLTGVALYGGATAVGISRMYEAKHWASDVIMGAAIGTFAGLTTVRWLHARPGNRLDRALLGSDASDSRVWVVWDAGRGLRLAPGF